MEVLSHLHFFRLFLCTFFLFSSIRMDFLSDDLILNIAERIVADSMHDLFSFMRTNKRHAGLCRSVEISRAFGNGAIELLIDLDTTPESLRFMHRLWDAGHHMFCILQCTQQLLHPGPRFDKTNGLLRKAEAANSQSAKYFHLLMRATSWPLVDEAEILDDFWEFLMTRNLQRHRSDILGGTTSFRFRCHWYKRWLPPGMVRRRFCNIWHNRPGDGRRGGYRGFLPADDEEYVFNHFCIRCRLDGEVRWLIDVFGFDHHA